MELSEYAKTQFVNKITHIKQIRVKNYTQDEAALFIGCSRKTLIDFEKGKIINYTMLCNYSKINGIKINL